MRIQIYSTKSRYVWYCFVLQIDKQQQHQDTFDFSLKQTLAYNANEGDFHRVIMLCDNSLRLYPIDNIYHKIIRAYNIALHIMDLWMYVFHTHQ